VAYEHHHEVDYAFDALWRNDIDCCS